MIPALAFNDATTITTFDARTAGEQLAEEFGTMSHFSPVGDCDNFFMKSSSIRINNLVLASAATTGIDFGRSGVETLNFVFLLEGNGLTNVDGVRYEYSATKEAHSSFGEEYRARLVGSGVSLRLDIQKLSKTCSAMVGFNLETGMLNKSQILSLQNPNFPFTAVFKVLLGQIDLCRGEVVLLSKLALDDSFYRLCATLICPSILLIDETRNGKRPYVRPEVNRLCEYITARLTHAISLTEMERMSGLSARILQRSFQSSFGLTPKQWIRKQRLHAARGVMLDRRETISITTLAYDFCFSSPSDFARHYALEFGEQPSHTLGRKIPSSSAKSSVHIRK